MLPLPTPNPDGDIGCLFELLNVKTENGRVLSAGFLLGVLRGKGPFAAVILTGEQGSAKSTFSTILRSIIDPHAAPTRRISRNADDLFIAARHNAVIVFDNISRLTEEVSDGLCILATGGGHAKRELYSDADETVLNYCRPFILNGIEGVADKADLIDRPICIELDIIPEDKRKTEADVWASFAAEHPDILGALLNAVATGLQRDGTIKHPSNLPRMADFAMWGMACETAFWPDGTLLTAYEQNRELSADVMIDGDLVARSVSLLVEQQTNESWTGTSSELLPLLAVIVGQEESRSDKWPKDATRLSTALMRVSPVLRKRGLEVKRSRVGTSRFISIQKTSRTDVEEKTVDLASPASPNGAEPEGYDAGDANCTGDSLTGINDKKPDDKIKPKNSDATPVCVCQW
jgi:hypothetical protein